MVLASYLLRTSRILWPIILLNWLTGLATELLRMSSHVPWIVWRTLILLYYDISLFCLCCVHNIPQSVMMVKFWLRVPSVCSDCSQQTKYFASGNCKLLSVRDKISWITRKSLNLESNNQKICWNPLILIVLAAAVGQKICNNVSDILFCVWKLGF